MRGNLVLQDRPPPRLLGESELPKGATESLSRPTLTPAPAPTPADISAAASPGKKHRGSGREEAEPRGLEEPRLKRVLDGVPERVPSAPLHGIVPHNLKVVGKIGKHVVGVVTARVRRGRQE